MRYLWRFLNLASLPLGAWTGYGSMRLDRFRGVNVDLVACIAVFLGTTLFALFIFLPSRREVLHRPGLDRSPLAWTRDPLQALFFTTLAALGMALGAQVRVAGSGDVGFWMVASLWCLFAGLFVGRLFGYFFFRGRITAA
jgi:hypothetical protein